MNKGAGVTVPQKDMFGAAAPAAAPPRAAAPARPDAEARLHAAEAEFRALRGELKRAQAELAVLRALLDGSNKTAFYAATKVAFNRMWKHDTTYSDVAHDMLKALRDHIPKDMRQDDG